MHLEVAKHEVSYNRTHPSPWATPTPLSCLKTSYKHSKLDERTLNMNQLLNIHEFFLSLLLRKSKHGSSAWHSMYFSSSFKVESSRRWKHFELGFTLQLLALHHNKKLTAARCPHLNFIKNDSKSQINNFFLGNELVNYFTSGSTDKANEEFVALLCFTNPSANNAQEFY